MRSLYSIITALACCIAFGACKKVELPDPVEGDPVFWIEADIGDNTWAETAGKRGYFMHTSFLKSDEDIYVFVGKLSPFDCDDCRESLEIRIWDEMSDSLRDETGFDEGLPTGPYRYRIAGGEAGPDIFRVAFQNQSSGTAPISYQWDFGDGDTSGASSPVHVYNVSSGEVEVCLDSEDADGCVTRICNEVLLDDAPCTVDFSHELSPGTSYVSFTAEATGTPPFVYRWDFGDGFSATLGNPGYFYAQPGQYEVCLEVTDFFGCKRSICKKIAADPVLCETAFSYNVEKVATISPEPQYRRVQIIWTDEDGKAWRSDIFQQPLDA
ncbi:MAG: PKD domain-containing protein, partial [Bacteroidota bacterium]